MAQESELSSMRPRVTTFAVDERIALNWTNRKWKGDLVKSFFLTDGVHKFNKKTTNATPEVGDVTWKCWKRGCNASISCTDGVIRDVHGEHKSDECLLPAEAKPPFGDRQDIGSSADIQEQYRREARSETLMTSFWLTYGDNKFLFHDGNKTNPFDGDLTTWLCCVDGCTAKIVTSEGKILDFRSSHSDHDPSFTEDKQKKQLFRRHVREYQETNESLPSVRLYNQEILLHPEWLGVCASKNEMASTSNRARSASRHPKVPLSRGEFNSVLIADPRYHMDWYTARKIRLLEDRKRLMGIAGLPPDVFSREKREVERLLRECEHAQRKIAAQHKLLADQLFILNSVAFREECIVLHYDERRTVFCQRSLLQYVDVPESKISSDCTYQTVPEILKARWVEVLTGKTVQQRELLLPDAQGRIARKEIVRKSAGFTKGWDGHLVMHFIREKKVGDTYAVESLPFVFALMCGEGEEDFFAVFAIVAAAMDHPENIVVGMLDFDDGERNAFRRAFRNGKTSAFLFPCWRSAFVTMFHVVSGRGMQFSRRTV